MSACRGRMRALRSRPWLRPGAVSGRDGLLFEGRRLPAISATLEAFVRAHLPRLPAAPGWLWVGETCWVATYTHAPMQPEHFAGWECLNPRQETPDA